MGGYTKQYSQNHERIFGMKPLLSKCCYATVNAGLRENGDHFYVCSKCLKKCAVTKGKIRKPLGVDKPNEGSFDDL